MKKNMIPIYKSEVADGLCKTITSTTSLAYVAPVVMTGDDVDTEWLTTAKTKSRAFLEDKQVDFDLHPIHTILATVGWNKNDDIFTKKTMWAARLTPEDKPFNLEHEPRKIIGHITGNTVVDDELNAVADDAEFCDVPDKFHILTSAVIYKHIASGDEELTEEATKLISGIENNEWFVSMECLFSDFDYALGGKIIARDEDTAFLTKHLRCYGGSGEYQGDKIGRVLRNITFSGKGLVANPANVESVIFNDTEPFNGVFVSDASVSEDTSNIDNDVNLGEDIMTEQKIAELEAQLTEARKTIEELGQEKVEAAFAEKDAEIAEANKKVEEIQAELDAAVASKEDAEKQISELTEVKEAVDKELDEAKSELAKIQEEALVADRVSILVDKGVAKDEAEKIVADFAGLDDEQFGKIAEMKAEISDKADAGETDSDAGETDEESDDAGEASASETDLDEAEQEQGVAGSTGDTEDEEEDKQAALAKQFEEAFDEVFEEEAKRQK